MLGVASERAFTVLAETFVVARADDAGQLAGLLENPRTSYNARFREFRKRLEPLRSALPPDLVDVLTLDAIADLLRVTRNAAGHPTGQEVVPSSVESRWRPGDAQAATSSSSHCV